MPLDKQVEALLAQMAETGGPALNELSPVEAREVAAGLTAFGGEP